VRQILVAVLLCLCAAAGLAAAASERLTLPGTGFSVVPLEGCRALIMSLAPSGGFAPNVNVQVQPYSGTRDQYAALSKSQLANLGLALVREQKNGASGWTAEYTGNMAGRDLHWYARAELKGGNVYLATATAAKEQWSSVSPKLKACVDSLRTTK
jgi:hypothetical protein